MASKEKILADLFDHGQTKRRVDLIEGKLKIEFRNIDVSSQFSLENRLTELSGESKRLGLQKYSIAILAHTLISWGSSKLSSIEDWEIFLQSQSVALVDKAVKLQQKFEKDIKEALDIESIEENFSQTAEPQEGSKLSRPESTPEKGEV